MSVKVEQLKTALRPDNLAGQIAQMWDKYKQERKDWEDETAERQAYLFATDTTKTSNRALPWMNSTTTPKLTQIADNLHANYVAATFPNDEWLKWEGFTPDDATKEKREAIEFYMKNKTRLGGFYTVISRCLHDYIEYGNAFADVEWVTEWKRDPKTGEQTVGYVGPKVYRISPMDIVVNPAAVDFESSPKIVRKILNFGELVSIVNEDPTNQWAKEAVAKGRTMRSEVANGIYSSDDFHKACAYNIQGFGNIYEYYCSPYVEILEFEGDLYDIHTGEYFKNHVITVMDRQHVLRKVPIDSWHPKGNKAHVGWRLRPDNLYAMGPLDNLVGMQYRIDHLENLKADVFDIIAHPPLKIKGEVEEFDWCPNGEIHMDENGDVEMLVPDTTALAADMQIQVLMDRMEEFAGAPKQAMGIRTPGEKTAYEVQALDSAAGRIFKEKVDNFAINFLEKLLNSMLEVSVRNMNTADTIRVFDDAVGQEVFKTVTKEDITANGKLRPIGARHFFNQQQLIQNMTGLMSSPVGEKIAPHVSSIKLAKLTEDLFGLERYQIIEENVAITEEADRQRMISVLQEQLVSEDAAQMAVDNAEEV